MHESILNSGDSVSGREKNAVGVASALIRELFVAILSATALFADQTYTSTIEGITWTYCINENGTAEIYNASNNAAVSPAPKGDLAIPDMLGERPVTRIRAHAFYNCSDLTCVTLPIHLMDIDSSAFEGCDSLVAFRIDEWNGGMYKSHEGLLLSYDGKRLVLAANGIETAAIPDSVTSIDEHAFDYCWYLTSATIPQCICSSQLSEIFRYTHKCLTNIVVSASVTSIGHSAFYGCNSLECVTIPDGVTSIGDYAFGNCYRLEHVVIPDSVTSIGYKAFDGCYNLMDVSIPQSVCLLWLSNVFPSSYSMITNVVISDSVKHIGDSVFYGCMNLTHVKLPDGIACIGDEAFADCRNLNDITIPNSVKSIGNGAFYGCSSLDGITIPDNVSTIGRSAFQDCRSLADVTIGNNVTNVGEYAFQDCVALTNVVIGSNVTRIDYGTFLNCTNMNAITIPDNVTSLMASAFQHCSGLTGIAIPDSVTNIDYHVFNYCSGLREVTIPQCVCSNKLSAVFPSAYGAITNVTISAGVTAIADETFRDCDGLVQMTIPGNVKVVGENAFRNCDSLQSVTIMDGVERIGMCAFMDCKNLSSVSIPDSVIKIEGHVFNSCNSSLLERATIGGVTVMLVDGWVVEQLNVTSFGKDVAIAGIRGIGDRMFSPVDWTGVTISGCKAIGDYAFHQNIGLKRVTFDGNMRSIGECAFASPRNLKSVVFQGDAPSVGPWSFRSTPEDCVVYIPQGNSTYDVSNGRWQGMRVRYYSTNGNFDVDEKGTVALLDDGYVVTASDGEKLTNLDFAFPIGLEDAYNVVIASDGKSATVRLNSPVLGLPDGESEASQDTSDPAGVLANVPESKISAKPTAKDDESVGALPVKTYSGLFYQASWGDDLGNMKSGDKIQATGDSLYLGVIKQTGDKGFYKLSVSEH